MKNEIIDYLDGKSYLMYKCKFKFLSQKYYFLKFYYIFLILFSSSLT